MRHSPWIFAVLSMNFFVICYLSAQGGDVYEAGPAPTIGDLKSETVFDIPLPRTRKTVGLKEEVNISVDAASWQDTDYKITGSGQEPVDDAKGTVSWAVGGGYTLSNDKGDSTKLTTKATPATITVTATIPDSGTKGKDTALTKTITFEVIAPTGILAISEKKVGFPGYEENAAGTRIGVASYFNYRLQPATVNFKANEFAELIPEYKDKWTWPDGTALNVPKQVVEFNVVDKDGIPNVGAGEGDLYRSGHYPRTRLIDKGTKKPADFTFDIAFDNAYLKEGGTKGKWEDYVNFKHQSSPTIYTGATGTGEIKFIVDNTMTTGKQGPWKLK